MHIKDQKPIPEEPSLSVAGLTPIQIFKELIADCQTEGLEFPIVIAGGAIRDSLLNKPYRDIDLYCNHEDYYKLFNYLNVNEDRRQLYQNSITESKSDEYIHQAIAAQVEFHNEDYGLINLIALHEYEEISSENVVSKFNIALNQAAFDGKQTYITPAFYKDVLDRTATVLRNDWGFAGTEKAVNKLALKYPEYKAVFPDETAWTRALAEERHSGQTSMDFGTPGSL